MGLMQLGSSLLGEASDWGRLMYQNGVNAKEAEKNRQFQSLEAEKAFDREVEFYEKYSSPEAQIRSARAAGVNPFGITGASSGPMASSHAPSGAQGSVGGSPASQLSDLALMIEDLQYKREVTKGQRLMNDHQEIVNRYEDDYLSGRNKLQDVNIQKAGEEINKLKSDIEVNGNRILVGNSEIESNMSEVEVNTAVAAFKRMETKQIEELLPYYKKMYEADSQESFNEAALALSRVALTDEEVKRVQAQTTSTEVGTVTDVLDSAGGVVSTGVLLFDMLGEVFGIEDAGQRWEKSKQIERDKKGRITSVTESGSGSKKKTTKKRRRKK